MSHKYDCAAELVALLADEDWDVTEYLEQTPPELVYADLQEQGYEWANGGWYTLGYLEEQRQAAAGKKPKPKKRSKKNDDLERLQAWNQAWGKQ